MSDYSMKDVLRMVEEEDVEFIRLQFTDLHGNLKNIAVTARQLEHVLEKGCVFDASAIDGTVRSEGSERVLVPDYSTFEIFPWRPQQGRVARLLCDVYMPDGTPSQGDPRQVLEQVLEKAKTLGYTFEVGPECEFFLFNTDENGNPTVETHEQASYFDVGPLDCGENARRDMVMTLEDMGFVIESSHHETAPAQHEIDLNYDEALRTADNIQTFKLAVRTIARRHGLHATFMPKPHAGQNGSGMHINISMKKDGKNLFGDSSDAFGLSKEAYWFVGGLLKHMKAIAAISNPLVNSYKRLVPGYEAPVYMAWSAKNRNQMIRVPAYRKDSSARIELRNPDSAANPYLTLAVCLAAGMDGIENKIEPPKPIDVSIPSLSKEERDKLQIEQLPATLAEALDELEKDSFIRSVLGETIVERYLQAKRQEWYDYTVQVSAWELKEYLNRY